ncbi:MAG TPA: hypothetical protein VEK56_07280 [Vicinamibacterales bacterium]|nr:hypothetical protein [Vicinamibacterales bacterium]
MWMIVDEEHRQRVFLLVEGNAEDSRRLAERDGLEVIAIDVSLPVPPALRNGLNDCEFRPKLLVMKVRDTHGSKGRETDRVGRLSTKGCASASDQWGWS